MPLQRRCYIGMGIVIEDEEGIELLDFWEFLKWRTLVKNVSLQRCPFNVIGVAVVGWRVFKLYIKTLDEFILYFFTF